MNKLLPARVLYRTLLLAIFVSPACRRATPAREKTKPIAAAPAAPAVPDHALPDFAVDAVDSHEGTAFWYDVPAQSLPQRRAWAGELTAASDTLPLNSYARVRRVDGDEPHKEIIVRITDDGIHQKGGLIDLNRDAAEALGMIKIGKATVRIEMLALKNATTDRPVDKRDAPIAPKASDLDGNPAASLQAEKDSANAKTDGKSAP